MYQRLRDFNVPAMVLDEIFANEKDLKTLEKSWKDLTLLIYDYAGNLGSRLHKINDCNYIGYAQWSNKETWDNSSNKLP